MKRCSLFCLGWWSLLLLLVIPALLLAVLLCFKWGSIEQDVANNVQANLADTAITWAQVETYHRGRDVLITGIAPNQEVAEQALMIAQRTQGVRVAEFVGDIEPPTQYPPELSIEFADDQLLLSGTVKDQATIGRLVELANTNVRNKKIINQLQADKNTSELPPMTGVFAARNNMPNGSSINFRQNKFTLLGNVKSAAQKNQIGASLAQLLPQGIDNQMVVVVDQLSRCKRLINELLSKNKINFATGKAAVKETSFGLLQQIADIVGECEEARFEISGHTDSKGALIFNNKLSLQRAEAVVQHLVNLGLESEKFQAAGYGPSQPIGDNETSQGRAQNRRIEFTLINETNQN